MRDIIVARWQVQISEIGGPLPAIRSSFAVLVDADDGAWTDLARARQLIAELLDAGCSYFVCCGKKSEVVHDVVDDVVVEGDYLSVVTAFHADEPKQDVVEYFKRIAMAETDGGLVLVRDVAGWKGLLARSSEDKDPS